MQEITLTLPEWAFLDATSYLGNMLENRDVLQHIPSFTIMEVLSLNGNEFLLDHEVKTRKFNYINLLEVEENYIILVHVSLADETNLESVLDAAVDFYKKYLLWDDENAIKESISKHN